jgi:hypothetical protein
VATARTGYATCASPADRRPPSRHTPGSPDEPPATLRIDRAHAARPEIATDRTGASACCGMGSRTEPPGPVGATAERPESAARPGVTAESGSGFAKSRRSARRVERVCSRSSARQGRAGQGGVGATVSTVGARGRSDVAWVLAAYAAMTDRTRARIDPSSVHACHASMTDEPPGGSPSVTFARGSGPHTWSGETFGRSLCTTRTSHPRTGSRARLPQTGPTDHPPWSAPGERPRGRSRSAASRWAATSPAAWRTART